MTDTNWKEVSKDDIVTVKRLEDTESYQFLSSKDPNKVVGYLTFQQGNPSETINGVSFESLLEIIAERLGRFQQTKFACSENAQALEKVIEARDILYTRAQRRKDEGTFGTQTGEAVSEEDLPSKHTAADQKLVSNGTTLEESDSDLHIKEDK